MVSTSHLFVLQSPLCPETGNGSSSDRPGTSRVSRLGVGRLDDGRRSWFGCPDDRNLSVTGKRSGRRATNPRTPNVADRCLKVLLAATFRSETARRTLTERLSAWWSAYIGFERALSWKWVRRTRRPGRRRSSTPA